MSKYKVGDKFYVAPCGRYGKEGHVTITKVGRKYAEIKFDKPKEHDYTVFRLNMETNEIISPSSYQVGAFYKTKEDYELDNKKKKFANRIHRLLSNFNGYKKLVEIPVDDLETIARILNVDLTEQ